MVDRKYHTFAEFWPFYVREHAEPRNRLAHVVGTTMVVALALAAAFLGKPSLLVLMPIAGYGLAWVGHFRLQRNVPATFTYPVWSLCADFKMWALTLTGRMQTELDRHC